MQSKGEVDIIYPHKLYAKHISKNRIVGLIFLLIK